MIITEKVQKESTKAWKQLEVIRNQGEFTDYELAIYMGYRSKTPAHSMLGSLARGSGLSQDKISRVHRLFNAPDPDAARALVSDAVSEFDEESEEEYVEEYVEETKVTRASWSDVREAAILLSESLASVTESVPHWALTEKVRQWKEVADEISEGVA